jgi:5'-nucleotidase
MRILLSNDDGYQAVGLRCLYDTLKDMTSVESVTVVAPERDRSGASHSLTLDRPLRVSQSDNGFYYINGTPTDCVHLALTGVLEQQPDLVIAGINAGANMGDDVLYSGTVAAAMEGRFLGLPAIAVSLVIKNNDTDIHHYNTAAQVVKHILSQVKHHPLPEKTILNINVPDQPYADISGVKVTRLGHRHTAQPAIKQTDPQGKSIYWVGPPGKAKDKGADTDFAVLSQGFASVTPLQSDMTRHEILPAVKAWLS